MDQELLNWAMTEGAQPYLQQFGVTPDKVQRYMSSRTQPQGNSYTSQIRDLINANPQNPKYQQELMGYYLDSLNPQNQQEYDRNQNENKLNTAISLMSSGDPAMVEWAKILIQGSFPELNNTGTSGYGDMGGSDYSSYDPYNNYLRKGYLEELSDPSNLSRDEYDFKRYLSTATDEQLNAYDKPTNLMERSFATPTWAKIASLSGIPVNWFASMFMGEAVKRKNAGYSGYSD